MKNQAENIGENLAVQISREFKTNDPRKIVKVLGVKVEEKEKGDFGELRIFSSYNDKRKTITIYKDNQQQSEYLLAHELFHYFECERNLGQKFKVLSESLAHSFAAKLLSNKK